MSKQIALVCLVLALAMSACVATASPSLLPPTPTRMPPTGTPLPTVTTTPTTWPPPTDVTFDFDDQISAFNKSVIQDGIAIGQHAFGNAGPIIVYARTNLDALMDTYYRHEQVSANNSRD